MFYHYHYGLVLYLCLVESVVESKKRPEELARFSFEIFSYFSFCTSYTILMALFYRIIPPRIVEKYSMFNSNDLTGIQCLLSKYYYKFLAVVC